MSRRLLSESLVQVQGDLTHNISRVTYPARARRCRMS